MALPEHEWLPQAKRLAVGMRDVVRHRHERRPNMKIGNERGRWWAWCHACKEGAVLEKDHVLLAPGKALPEPSELSVPSDLRVVLGSDYEVTVARFLASKGMDMQMLPKLWYSETRKRLCLQDPWGSGWHGRDLTDRSAAKWLHYDKPALAGQWGTAGFEGKGTTIITEDLFSMFKVWYAMRDVPRVGALYPLHVASTLGAGCSTTAALALKNCRRIVWAYDGDKAGDDGFASASKRMRVHVPKQHRARPPEGMDPKDMTCEAIRKMIEEAIQ